MPFCNLTGDISPLQLQINKLEFLSFSQVIISEHQPSKKWFSDQVSVIVGTSSIKTTQYTLRPEVKTQPEKDAYQKQ